MRERRGRRRLRPVGSDLRRHGEAGGGGHLQLPRGLQAGRSPLPGVVGAPPSREGGGSFGT